MPSFEKPTFQFDYDVAAEIAALRHYRDNEPGRAIPAKQNDRLLLGSWNVANLGLQQRRDQDHRLIAEIMSWFDLIAVQEVHDNLAGLRAVQAAMPDSYRTVFSDRSGNQERAAFLYDSDKVSILEKIGEVDVPVAERHFIRMPGITQEFGGFDRSPYLVAFEAGSFRFCAINVHLYFGDDSTDDRNRRALEAYAVSRWADLRRDDVHRYVDDFLVLGDFNLPKIEVGDPVYDALRRRGLRLPAHSTQVGSTLVNDTVYDQIFFFPGQTDDEFTGNTGVFDFDGAVFADLWNDDNRTPVQFRAYVRYYLSDHRPLWAEFAI